MNLKIIKERYPFFIKTTKYKNVIYLLISTFPQEGLKIFSLKDKYRIIHFKLSKLRTLTFFGSEIIYYEKIIKKKNIYNFLDKINKKYINYKRNIFIKEHNL